MSAMHLFWGCLFCPSGVKVLILVRGNSSGVSRGTLLCAVGVTVVLLITVLQDTITTFPI